MLEQQLRQTRVEKAAVRAVSRLLVDREVFDEVAGQEDVQRG